MLFLFLLLKKEMGYGQTRLFNCIEYLKDDTMTNFIDHETRYIISSLIQSVQMVRLQLRQ